MEHKARDRIAASTSRHHQEYPPTGPFLSHSLSNPMRRASSETRLEVLHDKNFLRRLEMKSRVARERDALKEEEGSDDWEGDGGGGEAVGDPNDGDTKSNLSEDEEALNLEFEACIQEHQDTKLKIFPKLFKCLNRSHFYTQLVVYYVTVIVIGVPMTIIWGCLSGTTVFARVWLWVPFLKMILFWLYSCAPVFIRPVQVLCVPLVDVCARRYRQIRIQSTLNGNGKAPLHIRNV